MADVATKKPKKASPPTDGRLQPHDLDAEMDLLSTVLRSRTAILKLSPVLPPDHLFAEQHRIIYGAALDVQAAGGSVSLSSVRSKLQDTGLFDRAGGLDYLTRLTSNRPDPEDLLVAAKRISDLHKLRMIGDFGHRCAAGVHEAADKIEVFAEEALRELGGIVYSGREQASDLQHVAASTRASVEAVKDRYERGASVSGVATGFVQLDEMTGGIHEGDVWYIAARPSIGKTSAALGMAANITAPPDPEKEPPPIEVPEYGAAYFSLEMPRDQLTGRLICMRAKIPFERWRSGQLRDQDWGPAYDAAEQIERSRLWIDETPGLTLEEAEAKLMAVQSEWEREPTFEGCPICTRQLFYQSEIKCWYCPNCTPDPRSAGALVFQKRKQLTRERRIKTAFFDYFGLMKGDPKARSREEEMGGISRGLKTFAKRRKVGAVVAAQLNRDVEKRNAKEKRPQLSDMRETGSTEQDADLVMFLYRASFYRPDDAKVQGKAEWIVAKQRNGPTGTIHLRYESSYSKFYEEETGSYRQTSVDMSLPPGL